MTDLEVWLTRRELSNRIKVPVATLAQWASQRPGPKYASFGRHARYRLSDVVAWENAQFDNGGDLDANVLRRNDPRGAAVG